MTEVDWNQIVTKIGVIIISVLALYLAFEALTRNLISPDQFMLILWAVLGAWGISIIGTGVFRAGQRYGHALEASKIVE